MSSSFIGFFSELLTRYSLYIWIFVLSIPLFLIGYYVYNNYFVQTLTISNEHDVSNMPEGSGKKVVLYYFYTTWCPHCTRATPSWDAISADYNGKEKNGYVIECIKVDCDNTDTSAELIEKYKVNGFPTIKMVKGGDIIDFDAEISQSSLTTFINDMV